MLMSFLTTLNFNGVPKLLEASIQGHHQHLCLFYVYSDFVNFDDSMIVEHNLTSSFSVSVD